MDKGEFARLHQLRAPNLMWLLGAGASASAGVPTADDMVLEFKRDIYCSRQGVAREIVGDLGDPLVRRHLQRYFDDAGSFPAAGDADEYAVYFEEAFPDEGDRRRYLDLKVQAGRPTYGHYGLAALLTAGRTRAVWTTNVDHLVEDATALTFGGTGGLAVATLGTADSARDVLLDGTRPLLAKLHGDYQHRRLKMIRQELQDQDAVLRAALIDACGQRGLIVVGYSGRDASVMHALGEAARTGRGFPAGLFWICRSAARVLPAVPVLLAEARANGVQAELLEVPTFDEFVGDVLRLEPALPADVVRILDAQRPRRLVDATIPDVAGGFPVVRLNAVPVTEAPTLARFVGCAPPTWRDLRDRVRRGGDKIVAVPTSDGVLGYGADADVRAVLSDRPIREFDLRPVGLGAGIAAPEQVALLMSAMAEALARGRPLRVVRTKTRTRLVVTTPDAPELEGLRRVLGTLSGTVPNVGLAWSEGIDIDLEHRFDTLWLLLDPSVWVDWPEDEALTPVRTAFVNAHYEKRYNRQANNILAAWVAYLIGTERRTLTPFGDIAGVNAAFEVEPVTAFSYRVERGPRRA